MPETDDVAERLRREFVRQSPQFDLGSSLPGKVSALVRRRQRRRVIVAVATTAAVIAAVAVPLSALRSAPLGHTITPGTAPVSSAPLSCDHLDLWAAPAGTTPVGTAITTTTTLGQVTATLTGTTATVLGGDPALSDPMLTVGLGAGHRFSEAVPPPTQVNAVIPWSIAPLPPHAASTPQIPNNDALCLADFPGESLPTVLLGLWVGGAHCCTIVRAISLSPAGLGPAVDDDLGNPGASLSADGDDAMIVTADNAFAYEFASFAASGMPVKILQFGHGTFVDVTKQHLDLVTADASQWWTTFNASPGNGLGELAAWVADECTLGRGASAWSTVAALEAQGELVGPGSPDTNGAAYVSSLKTFLAQHGYCSS